MPVLAARALLQVNKAQASLVDRASPLERALLDRDSLASRDLALP